MQPVVQRVCTVERVDSFAEKATEHLGERDQAEHTVHKELKTRKKKHRNPTVPLAVLTIDLAVSSVRC